MPCLSASIFTVKLAEFNTIYFNAVFHFICKPTVACPAENDVAFALVKITLLHYLVEAVICSENKVLILSFEVLFQIIFEVDSNH